MNSLSARPFFTSQYCGIFSIGPGRYRATRATISSMQFGFIRLNASIIPLDSTWNTATVLALAYKSNVALSSRSIVSMLSLMPRLWIKSIAPLTTVRVFNPKKSNLTKPACSTHFILNCVAGISDLGS